MVGGFQAPPTQVGLPYSGTFVEENGLYCMSRKIFWDSWLIKQLKELVKMMAIVPDEPDISYDPENPEFPWKNGIRLHAGDSSSADSDYDLKVLPLLPSIWYRTGPTRSTEAKAYGGGDTGIMRQTGRSCVLVGSEKFT